MEPLIQRAPPPPAPRRWGWLAWLLSLTLHGGLLLYLYLTPAEQPRQPLREAVNNAVPGAGTTLLLLTTAPDDLDDAPSARELPRVSVSREIPTPSVDRESATPPTGAAAAMTSPSPQVTGAPEGGHANHGSSSEAGGLGFLDAPAQARSVVYVIDHSLSMGFHDALDAALREVCLSVASLPASTRFQVVVYNTEAEILPIGGRADLVPATSANVREVAALLQDLRAERKTDHVRGLRRALELSPEVIFLVTDAPMQAAAEEDLTADEVRLLTRINHGRSAIHTIELTTSRQARGEGALAALAEANHGTHRIVNIAAP